MELPTILILAGVLIALFLHYTVGALLIVGGLILLLVQHFRS